MMVKLKSFDELLLTELYQIVQLREKVFTFEQKVEEEDFDGEDLKAMHVFLEKDNHVVAYGRFFKPGDKYGEALSFGRFVVSKAYRGQGFAQAIFQKFLDYAAHHYPEVDIVLSSQYYIKNFYEKFAFKGVGDI